MGFTTTPAATRAKAPVVKFATLPSLGKADEEEETVDLESAETSGTGGILAAYCLI